MTTATSIATPSSSRPRARRKVAKKKVAKKPVKKKSKPYGIILPTAKEIAAEMLPIFVDRRKQENINNLRTISIYFCYIENHASDAVSFLGKLEGGSSKARTTACSVEVKVSDLVYYIDQIHSQIKNIRRPRYLITEKSLANSIEYLMERYASMVYKNGVLTVQTDDIILEYKKQKKNFGPFNIILDLNRTDSMISGLFAIRALSPVRNNNYIHPNVSDGALCCGEGEMTLWQCIRQGRIGDFMDIVQQILKTHSNSPHWGIRHWFGEM